MLTAHSYAISSISEPSIPSSPAWLLQVPGKSAVGVLSLAFCLVSNSTTRKAPCRPQHHVEDCAVSISSLCIRGAIHAIRHNSLAYPMGSLEKMSSCGCWDVSGLIDYTWYQISSGISLSSATSPFASPRSSATGSTISGMT
jgi:hypothetical protein